jgi:septum formation protein
VKIILASASPRRKELLSGLGLSFEVVPSLSPEEGLENIPPDRAAAHALVLAGRKADEVVGRVREAMAARPAPGDEGEVLIVAADTLVVLPDRILGKPGSRDEAREMLRALAGREHRVVTAVVVTELGSGRTHGATEETVVRFRPLDAAAIDAYVATGEPDDKAGAYAVQGVGSLLVESIGGDYFNVVGLPLGRLAGLLQHFGIDLLVEAAARAVEGTRRD